MISKKSTWKYNKLLTARRNYYSLGSIMNSVAGNPKDGKLTTGLFKGMSSNVASGLGALGSAVGGMAGGLIGGGMSSGAGSVISGLGDVASNIPGPWGAIASAALKTIGGLTDRAFGAKMNEENIAKVDSNISQLNSFLTNASDYDALASNWSNATQGMEFDDSFIGKDGWFSTKAKDKAASLRTQVNAGNKFVLNSLANNAQNILNNLMNMLEANVAADGGYIKFQNGGNKKKITSRRVDFSTYKPFKNRKFIVKNMELLLDSLINRGFTDYLRAAIMSSVLHESGGDPKASSATGKYKGLLLWSPDRYPNTEDLGQQIHYLIESSLNPKSPNWTDGGSGAPKINTGKEIYDFFWGNPGPYNAGMYYNKGYVRPNDQQARINRAVEAKNMVQNMRSFGGELNTQGSDFTNGLLYIDNGGPHETNPYEGVPMGVDSEGIPNLVEEGETIFNDYVFSKRMAVPKAVRTKYKLREGGFLSFADASKKLAKESEERPNDPISQRGLEAMMSMLAQSQEEVRGIEKEGNMAAYGGNLFLTGSQMEMYKDYLNSDNTLNFDLLHASNSPWMARRKQILDLLQGDSNKSLNFRTEYAKQYNTAKGLTKDKKGFLTPEAVTYDFLDKGTNDRVLGTNYDLIANKAFDQYLGPARTIQERHMLRGANGLTELPEAQRYYEGRNTSTGNLWSEANPTIQRLDNGKYVSEVDPKTNVETRTYFYDSLPVEEDTIVEPAPGNTTGTGGNNSSSMSYLRYAPAVSSGIMAITDAFNSTNAPDYTESGALMEAARAAGQYTPVAFNPIGNYMTYRPFDRDYAINKLNAEAGASRRALLNTSGGNRATAMAGILAADNNYLNQLGELTRKAEEYNLAQRQQVEDFNRATNQANSTGFLQAATANQKAAQEARDAYFKGALASSELRQKERQASTLARSTNLSNFVNSLGDIGREEFARNMIISDPSKYYTIDSSGKATYKKEFYNLLESQQDQVTGHALRRKSNKKGR